MSMTNKNQVINKLMFALNIFDKFREILLGKKDKLFLLDNIVPKTTPKSSKEYNFWT